MRKHTCIAGMVRDNETGELCYPLRDILTSEYFAVSYVAGEGMAVGYISGHWLTGSSWTTYKGKRLVVYPSYEPGAEKDDFLTLICP